MWMEKRGGSETIRRWGEEAQDLEALTAAGVRAVTMRPIELDVGFGK